MQDDPRDAELSPSFVLLKQKTAYDIYQCDWSSDVCSSDLSGWRHDPTGIGACPHESDAIALQAPLRSATREVHEGTAGSWRNWPRNKMMLPMRLVLMLCLCMALAPAHAGAA